MPPRSNGSQHADAHDGQTSFSQLVREHHRWAKQLHGRREVDEETRERYQAALTDFESSAGTIVDAYWCLKDASAVALTARKPKEDGIDGFIGRLVGRRREPALRLYRVTDWVTADTPALADLLHSCDILAIRATEGLEGTSRRIAMQWILAVETHVLGFVERSREHRIGLKQLQSFVAGERKELENIEAYINSAGDRAARIFYVQGMLVGLVPLVSFAFVIAFLLSLFDVLDLHDDGIRAFFGAYAAGATGAIVSVLTRMGSRRDNFAVDHEMPRWGLYTIGLTRPFVGAVFGLAIYLLVQTPLLQIDKDTKTFAFYVTAAFLAGFSERWTRVILDGAQTVIAGEGQKPEVTEADLPAVDPRGGELTTTTAAEPG